MNTKNFHDLAALLTDPAFAQEVPPLLAQLAADRGRLGALEVVLPPPTGVRLNVPGAHMPDTINMMVTPEAVPLEQ